MRIVYVYIPIGMYSECSVTSIVKLEAILAVKLAAPQMYFIASWTGVSLFYVVPSYGMTADTLLLLDIGQPTNGPVN